MKYVIMADGKGTRWNNFNNIPKHLIEINGETLLSRTVRLLRENNIKDIIITSHDERYNIEGAQRYEPLNNNFEVDRYTEELITEPICFLYGDTYYTDKVIKKIVDSEVEDIQFFGNKETIIAVKVTDYELFKINVDNVRKLFIEGKINKCIGWQVYQSVNNLPYEGKVITERYEVIMDGTDDINSPEEYETFIKIKNMK